MPGRTWIDNRVIDRANEAGAHALSVYLALARWAGADGVIDQRHSSLVVLMASTGLCRQMVINSIRRIEWLGWITVNRSTGARNAYQLVYVVDRNQSTPQTPAVYGTDHYRSTEQTAPVYQTDSPIPYSGTHLDGKRDERPHARATAIPADWEPTAEDRAAAHRILDGMGLDIDAAAEAMRDYYLGSGTTRADWSAAWRSWCRREVGYAAARPGRNGNGHGAGMNGSLAERAAIIEQQLRGKGLCDDG